MPRCSICDTELNDIWLCSYRKETWGYYVIAPTRAKAMTMFHQWVKQDTPNLDHCRIDIKVVKAKNDLWKTQDLIINPEAPTLIPREEIVIDQLPPLIR